MPLRHGLRAHFALVAVLVLGLADGPPTHPIALGESVSGVVGADAVRVYLLEVPAGAAGFAVEVRVEDRGAGGHGDLAVFYGDERLPDDARSGPIPAVRVANPRAGAYRIVVANPGTEDLEYVLSVVVDGDAVVEPGSDVGTPGTGPVGHGACETDGACRAP